MIVSIGVHCLLRNWLYMKYKEIGKEYRETLFSGAGRISADYPQVKIDDVLRRYSQVCDNFSKTGYEIEHWYICEKEGFKIHFGKRSNLDDILKTLPIADVILFQ